ncbi:MAG: glutamine synthetase family protein [Gammaproteobacteria bacterium]|nr:glutamine synthetase family protein [Gammaproteobacteria bacterium]
MDLTEKMKVWLAERDVVNLEMMVADMAGVARGKMQPTAQLSAKGMKLPIAIFAQTINNDYYMPKENVADRDMNLQPDVDTLRLVPWATETTASVLMDCYDIDGRPVETSPRAVLKRVLKTYADRGWTPVVAPEVEFYLTQNSAALPGKDEFSEGAVAVESDANLSELSDPYGLQSLHDLGGFFEDLSAQCRTQDIHLGAVSQELGPAQFEVNFEHGAPLKLADDVFHFKRTIKQVAAAHGMRATFLAKPFMDDAGSSMHIHQSVYDDKGANIFSDTDGEASELFNFYLGGLQGYMRSILLLFAPYANSYRRFLNYYASPVNLEWGVDNRTAGLRVPRSDANARRVENRLAGSDVNPYLAIAGSLACGLLGMAEKVPARAAVVESAQELPFALHRHLYEALDALRESPELHEILGAEFVTQYCAVKELEYREFQRHISDWERKNLMFSV